MCVYACVCVQLCVCVQYVCVCVCALVRVYVSTCMQPTFLCLDLRCSEPFCPCIMHAWVAYFVCCIPERALWVSSSGPKGPELHTHLTEA
jgi:hypothetical protein